MQLVEGQHSYVKVERIEGKPYSLLIMQEKEGPTVQAEHIRKLPIPLFLAKQGE